MEQRPYVAGSRYREPEMLEEAARSSVASKFLRDRLLTDFNGQEQRIDVVEMYLPIPDAATGKSSALSSPTGT